MRILDRYVGRTVQRSVLLALLVLVTVKALLTMLDEMRDLGEGQYRFGQAIGYVFLMLPQYASDFFVVSILMGGLIGLGLLANHQELVVMRSHGISVWRIVGSVFKALGLLVAAAIILAEWVAPAFTQAADRTRTEAITGGQLIKSVYGYWARDHGEFIHIQHIVNTEHLRGVVRFVFDPKQQLQSVVYAQQADYQERGVWQLQDVKTSWLESSRVRTVNEAQQIWQSDITPDKLALLQLKPEQFSYLELYRYYRYLKQNGLASHVYELAFWAKLWQPLAMAVMLLLALACVFGPLRSASVSGRIVAGILLGLLFMWAKELVTPLSLVYAWPPMLSALLPIVVFFLIAVVMMRRVA